jgi:hypothetical protein
MCRPAAICKKILLLNCVLYVRSQPRGASTITALSVCTSVTTQEQLNGFSRNLIFGSYT